MRSSAPPCRGSTRSSPRASRRSRSSRGYGLETEAELRQLRAARRLGEERPVSVAPTYLGAHAVPPGGDRVAYVRSIIDEALPRIAAEGLADAVDAFQETIALHARGDRGGASRQRSGTGSR